ncbi:6-bladed beta-propeller [Algoriphagus hitonicola]|uniref:6-bladed beta-propeller protein n=1 Tax=Algoriphagus hitonicola TaxID=435880 RepID=A0A1I2NNJ5_9BACT|nr:6-bladed beta-propeller [Algoriphagus hitonicola]SFG05432.1 protein of unknown function [Algoriphagus hitonicola]
MKIKFILPICLGFLVSGCSENKKTFEVEVWNLHQTQLSELKLSELVSKDYQLVPLETTDSSLISKIDKIIIGGDYIFVLDGFSNDKVKRFSQEGKYLGKIGNAGAGPGEYRNPVDMYIDGDFLMIYDNPDNLLKYDFEGKFIENIRTGETGFKLEKSGDGNYALINGGLEHNLLVMNENFQDKKTFFPYKSRFVDQLILYPLVKLNDGSLLYRRYLNDTIYKIESKEPIPYLVLDHGEDSFSLEKNWSEKEINDSKLEGSLANYAVNQLYLENSTHLLVFFFKKSTPQFAVRNKKSKASVLLDFINFENDITFSQNFAFTHVSNDNFIAAVDPAFIFMNKLENESYPDKMMPILEGLEEGDNPILLIAKFKI